MCKSKTIPNIHLFSLLKLSASLSILVMCLTGCVSANFTKPVASLQQSINTSGSAIGAYYAGLNAFERKIYLEQRAYDPTLRVEMTDSNHLLTPLVGQLFNAQSIKARMDAISLLGAYAGRLAELAGRTAPQDFATSAQALGTNINNLKITFGNLGVGDKTASSYVGPISQLVGVLVEMYLKDKRDALVTKAVQDGAPEFNKILDLLQNDLVTVVGPLKETGIEEQLATRVVAYNNNSQGKDALSERQSMTIDQRKSALDEIDQVAQQYDLLISFNPNDAISGIRDANNALVKYAKSDKSPQNFSELLTAMEVFQNQAQVIATAVQQIRSIK